jgi:hypothetical protein
MKDTEDHVPVPGPAKRPSTTRRTTPPTTAPKTASRGPVEDLVNMDIRDMSPEQRARFEIKREHEFYSYYEPIRALATREMDWTDLNSDDAVAKHRPVQSSDKALTAFCQLAAIRLKMRRAMIFFFDTTHAYILAEATRTLSLHDENAFDDEEDSLWLGTTKIPRGFSVCEHVRKMKIQTQRTSLAEVTSNELDSRAGSLYKYYPFPPKDSANCTFKSRLSTFHPTEVQMVRMRTRLTSYT